MPQGLFPIAMTLPADLFRHLYETVRDDLGKHRQDYPTPKRRMIEEWLSYAEGRLADYEIKKVVQEKLPL